MKFHIKDNGEDLKVLDAADLDKSSTGVYTYVLTGLEPNSKHSISVSADNGEGEGTASPAIDVTTSAIGVTSITLSIAKTAYVGDTLTATITIVPPDATDKTVTYSLGTGQSTLASIDADGKLTCKAPGTSSTVIELPITWQPTGTPKKMADGSWTVTTGYRTLRFVLS